MQRETGEEWSYNRDKNCSSGLAGPNAGASAGAYNAVTAAVPIKWLGCNIALENGIQIWYGAKFKLHSAPFWHLGIPPVYVHVCMIITDATRNKSNVHYRHTTKLP